MIDQDQINRLLREGANSELEQKVLTQLRSYARASTGEMSKYWDQWEQHELTYRGVRMTDKEDAEAASKGQPTKLIIPITYAQIQTGLAFTMGILSQRPHFFELIGTGPEDQGRALALETDLDWQMRKNQAMLKMYLWHLDAFKLGFGVVKSYWAEEHIRRRVRRQVQSNQSIMASIGAMFGFGSTDPQAPSFEEAVEEVLSYQGTRIENIRPYNFLPDPSNTLAQFQRGEFVGHEEETTLGAIRSKEGQLYHGTEHIQERFDGTLFKERARYAGRSFSTSDPLSVNSLGLKNTQGILLTEFEFNLTPHEWTEKTGVNFGSERYATKWIATMANDSKLIRLEPSGYLHGHFNYDIIEFSPDQSSFYNPGVADTINNLQETMTWLLNSHIVNVRKVIRNQFVGDPAKIFEEDVASNRTLIRTRGSQRNVTEVLKQLQVTDVTANHVSDVDVLNRLVQVVTGINENALGQYSTGRRSATEARNVSAGAAARLKMHAQLAWESGIQPLGVKFLANLRQWRTKEVYDHIVGDTSLEYPFETTVLTDPMAIACGYDFAPLDTTLPSEKANTARLLTELWTSFFTLPPEMQQHYNLDPRKLLSYIAQLYGIKNLSDFSFSAQGQQLQVGDPAQLDPSGSGQPVDVMGEDMLRQLAQQQT